MSNLRSAKSPHQPDRGSTARLGVGFRRYSLVFAVLILAVCFALAGDYYRSAAVAKTGKQVIAPEGRSGRTINWQEMPKLKIDPDDPNAKNREGKVVDPGDGEIEFRTMAGGDTCGAATQIPSLPYSDNGTTVGAVDNYDLPPDTTNPTVTGCPTCVATGAGPAGSLPRGAVYTGTGTGPDVAYSITFSSPAASNSINVTVDPTTSADLTVIVYTNVCSSSLADAIVIDDTGIGGVAENVVVSNMPPGTYHIVVDAYSTGGAPPGPSGPYSLNVTGTGTVVPPAPPAVAQPIYAVNTANQLLLIDKTAPGTTATVGTITGLGAGERILGLDTRPANGDLYGLGITDNGTTRTGRLYLINPTNAVATPVGAAFSTTLADVDFWGFNFNPRVDRIRVTNRNGQNLRVNPNDGTLAGSDTNLSTTGINGLAYDRNLGGATTTTLYGLNFDTDQFGTIGGINGTPSPNLGVFSVIGSTGIIALDSYQLDIESISETARATANGNLYTVNLGSGAFSLVGAIGGAPDLRGMTHPQPAFTTSMSLASSANSSVFGQSVAFTASVLTAPVGGVPVGTVQFFDNLTLIGSAPVANGSAAISVSSLAIGNHPITARFVSSHPAFPIANATLTGNPQVVVKANTTTIVQTAQNAPVYGQSTTITASLVANAPGSGTPQGNVNFLDGATPIAACQNVALNALGAATCSLNTLGAGTHTINVNYLGNANYNTSSGSAQQTVLKAPLNVLASSHTVTYGDAAPAVTSTITGFVLGETTANLGTQPTCSTTYTQGASVSGSQYPTSCSGGVSGNYSFNYINGTVTVNKKGLTVTADAKTRAYGAANPALTATITGFVGADNAGNSTTGSAGLSTTATATSPVGSYPITATLGTLASTNYSFTNFVGSTLSVTAVQLTVTANNQTRVFGAPNPTLTFSITGFVNGEGVGALTGTPNISTPANATSAPGAYMIGVTQGTLASPNYTFTTANGTLTVTQASTTTTITNAAALGNPTSAGQSYAVNWTTSPVAPATGTPTGNVTVTDGTATCTAAVGAGTCNLTSTTSGTKTITATYAGDANFGGSTSQSVQHNVVNALTGNVKQFIAFGTNTNLAGVTLTLLNTATQQATTTTTDAGGNYTFSTALGQSYTITPSGLGKAFEATSRTYTNVAGNISGADFIAYDVPGPNAIPRSARVSSQIATQGQPVTVPVLITTTGVETRVSFSVEYPVGPLGVPTVTCGTGAVNCTLSVNNSLSGKVGITVTPANSNPLPAGTRELVRVTFPTQANPATSAAIRFGDFPTARDVRNAENNPLPMLYWTDGLVSFTGGTLLDGASISGRVTTAAGQGLRNATVTLIDTAGGRRTTVTSSFGAYQFEGLDLGKDYMLVVTSKRYRFATQTVNLSGNLSDVNLIGLE